MSKSRSKKRSKKRRTSSTGIKDFCFVDCPVAGAAFIETEKSNRLYMFDSIDFIATDQTDNCFDVEGLRFDQNRGWYEKDAVVPKYYGKGVYNACMEYAVDRAMRDNLYLGVALLGKERPGKVVLKLSHSEIVSRLESRGCCVVC